MQTQPLIVTPKSSPLPVIILSMATVFSLGISAFLFWQNRQLQTQLTTLTAVPPTQPTPVPTTPADPTSNWETYISPKRDYSFKHPAGLKSDTDAAGTGIESIRFSYQGDKQVRKEGMLSDGYSFVVTRVPEAESTARLAQKERDNSVISCRDINTTGESISPVSDTTVGSKPAKQYSISNCLADAINIYVENNQKIYRITLEYVGTPADMEEYKQTANQILSTFKFLEPAGKAVTGTPGAGCKVGGCSGELCLDAAGPDMASTCLYKAEYACYKTAACAKQSDGRCGWTQTPALTTCLQAGGVTE